MASESTGAKVSEHPDLNEIVQMMHQGVSVKKIEIWLKERYLSKKNMHLSYATLQTFRRKILKLSGDALQKLKQQSVDESPSSKEKAIEKVRQTPAYKAIVASLADEAIEIESQLTRLNTLIKDRIKSHLETLGDQGEDIKVDKQLLKWVEQLRFVAQDYAKLVQGRPDHVSEHNINITVMNEYADATKQAFMQTLQEIDPEKVPRFVELLDEKLKKLKPVNQEQQAQDYFKAVTAVDAKYEEASDQPNKDGNE